MPTRLKKLATDRWHAIILAEAGLARLGLHADRARIEFEENEFFTAILPHEIFVPAGGQGIVAMQIRADDEQLQEIVSAVNDFDTRLVLRAEREFLRLLQADCNQPVAVLATVEKSTMKMRGQIFDAGATTPREGSCEGRSEDAEKLAAELFQQIGE